MAIALSVRDSVIWVLTKIERYRYWIPACAGMTAYFRGSTKDNWALPLLAWSSLSALCFCASRITMAAML